MKKIIILLLLISTLGLAGCKKNEVQQSSYPFNRTYYEIFIRSFADSNGDGIGDIKGITNNLDYLNTLGIEGIWLTPFHPSNSYHGYDVLDYYEVNKDFGTLADLEELVSEAKKLNIAIMMDLVINHTSDNHPWFIASKNNDPIYRNYYVWNNTNAYEAFPGGMKDLNLKNPAVIEEINRIGKFWLGKGITGFRLDAAKHFFDIGEHNDVTATNTHVKNYMFVYNFREAMRKNNEEVYVVSEVIDTSMVTSKYFVGTDSCFNFDLADSMLLRANGGTSYNYVNSLINSYKLLKEFNRDFVDSPILTNHDFDRVATRLNGDMANMKLAAELLLSLPGSPFIYYGDEIGMFGESGNGKYLEGYGNVYDELRRLPFKWGNENDTKWFTDNQLNASVINAMAQVENKDSLFNTYQNMLQARKTNIALKYGNNLVKSTYTDGSLQSYVRYFEDGKNKQALMVLHNLSIKEIDISHINFNKVIYQSTDFANTKKIPGKQTLIVEINYNKICEYSVCG